MEGIAKFLPAAVRQQIFRSESSMLELLKSLWSKMVGQGIARQCRPIELTSGTLTIVTSCPTWAVQFRQLNDEIRSNINKFLGGEHIKRLRVRVDPLFSPSADAKNDPLPQEMMRPTVKVTPGPDLESDDALGIVKQSFQKYFSRNDRKAN